MKPATYKITLTNEEEQILNDVLTRGKHTSQKTKRAQAMLNAHRGMFDRENATACHMHRRSIEEIRKNFVTHGFELTLNGIPKKPQSEKITIADEARLIALACEKRPEGCTHWSLRILKDKFLALESVTVNTISHETIRKTLKKTNINHGKD